MLLEYFPLICGVSGCVLAQIAKPFCYYAIHGVWRPELFYLNGSMPSSHSALVSALSIAVGIKDGYSSTVFALSLALACIVCFDAANVRFYAGQNISVTQKLIEDLKELSELKIDFEDPIYAKKMKEVLGHTYMEVFGGILLGIITTVVLNLFI